MRQFFILSYDDDESVEAVVDREMSGFDVTTFWSGDPFAGEIPEGVRIFVGDGAPSDFPGNPLSWHIASPRFVDLVRPVFGGDCQYLDVPLIKRRTGQAIDGYRLLNVTRVLPATSRTSAYRATTSVFAANIPSDAHVFRPAESRNQVVVTDAVLDAIRGKGLRGVALIRLESI